MDPPKTKNIRTFWGSILLICCQRLSVMGSHSAFIPMSGAPDSLLVFSTHCALTIL